MYLQQDAAGMQDFDYAVKEKMTADHEVINDAIREKAVVSMQDRIRALNFIHLQFFGACRVTPSFPYLLG